MEQIKKNNADKIYIAGRAIGEGEPSFIIAEIGQAHDGSLGTAHSFIDAVAKTGADAIKFQTHIAAEESTLDEPFRIKFSQQDSTRYDYWKRMEFTEEQWTGLAKHAKDRGLIFLSSAFSVKAVEMLRRIGMPAWKIGSGEVRSEGFLDVMAINGSPVLLSTGMSNYPEIQEIVSRLRKRKMPFAIFQCTTKYPNSLKEVGLNVINKLRNKFNCPVGLSDHSGTVFPALAAMAIRSDLIEVHVTFDRRMFGPDVISSITIEDLKLIVDSRTAFYEMFNNPVDKNDMATNLVETRSLFTKSLAPDRPLCKGAILREDMLILKKPGTGIPAQEIKKITGRRLKNDVTPDRLLKWTDLENEKE